MPTDDLRSTVGHPSPATLIERERQVLSQIVAGVPLGKVLSDLLRAVEAQSAHDMLTSILFLSEDGRHLNHGAAPNLPAGYNAAVDGIAIDEGVGSCGTVASRGTPVYASDIATDPLWVNFRDLALSHGLRACWSTPICASGGQFLGTFAIYYRDIRFPTANDIEAIAFVTQTAALAIERHAIDRNLQRSQDELRRLNGLLEQQVENRTRDLVRSEAKADAYFSTSPEYLFLVRVDGDRPLVFEDLNPACERVFNRSRADVVGCEVASVVPPASARDIERHARACCASGKIQSYQAERRYDGGPQTLIDALVAPVQVEAPERGLVLFSGRDITEQRKVEEQLRQAQKMEAVGQLTGGLAHDFNNLLAGISGALELMQVRIEQGRLKDVERYMVAAQGASRRAAALTHRLLAFSRRQTLDPKPTDVNRLVAGMEDLIRRTVGPSITVETVGSAGLWPTLVDPPQLENALLNLCINARDAMPDGGRITVETANKWLDSHGARTHDMPPGQYLSLCVSDTGTGMTPEVIARVFEPFFTTKPIGEGTGLGLSMIYGFAKQSGGQVRIYSEVGEGTTVCIYLPRHLGALDTDVVALGPARPARAEQGETVLVVDDEPTVRMLVTDVLVDLGYTAIEAADSVAGLKVLRSDVRIDLLVTDVGLPGGMNGRQMADAARVTRRDLKVLFITGYAENAAIGNGHLETGMQVLTKPFPIEALAGRIQKILGKA